MDKENDYNWVIKESMISWLLLFDMTKWDVCKVSKKNERENYILKHQKYAQT